MPHKTNTTAYLGLPPARNPQVVCFSYSNHIKLQQIRKLTAAGNLTEVAKICDELEISKPALEFYQLLQTYKNNQNSATLDILIDYIKDTYGKNPGLSDLIVARIKNTLENLNIDNINFNNPNHPIQQRLAVYEDISRLVGEDVLLKVLFEQVDAISIPVSQLAQARDPGFFISDMYFSLRKIEKLHEQFKESVKDHEPSLRLRESFSQAYAQLDALYEHDEAIFNQEEKDEKETRYYFRYKARESISCLAFMIVLSAALVAATTFLSIYYNNNANKASGTLSVTEINNLRAALAFAVLAAIGAAYSIAGIFICASHSRKHCLESKKLSRPSAVIFTRPNAEDYENHLNDLKCAAQQIVIPTIDPSNHSVSPRPLNALMMV